MTVERRIADFESAVAEATARITEKTNANLITKQSAERRIRRYRSYCVLVTLVSLAVVAFLITELPATDKSRLFATRPSADLKMNVAATKWGQTQTDRSPMIVVEAYGTSWVETDSGMWWWLIISGDNVKPSNAELVTSNSGQKFWAIPAEAHQWTDASNVVRNGLPGCDLQRDGANAGRWICGGLHTFKIDQVGPMPQPLWIALGNVKSWGHPLSIYGMAQPGTQDNDLTINLPGL